MNADRIRNPSFKFPPEAPYIQKPDRPLLTVLATITFLALAFCAFVVLKMVGAL